jgi:hypothetical protein
MGAWGPGLYQDDVAQDVKEDYVKLLKTGKTNQEATDKLIEDYQMTINDFDDAPVFWFILADTQWKLGRLLPNVKEQALRYLESEDDLKKWENQNKANYKYRIKVLSELKDRLNSPMPAEKKIALYKYFRCSWNVGDTYAYRLESEHAKDHNLYGHYFIIHKIDEYRMRKGDDYDVLPIVYTKITKSTRLPKAIDELNNDCDFVRYMRSPIPDLYEYKTINNTNSSKIQRKMIFIGNYTIESPKDEYIEKDIGFPINTMKLTHYEETKIDDYLELGN